MVEARRPVGRPRKTWLESVEADMAELEIDKANSVQCTLCKKWIHKRCSGVRGDLSRVADGFKCRRCDGTESESES